MAWTNEKVEVTLKSVIEKAQADQVFRQKLKNNPREVLVHEGNEAIPESFRICVVDLNDADIVITLPKIESSELSDADLENIAGGKEAAEERITFSDFINTRSVAIGSLSEISREIKGVC